MNAFCGTGSSEIDTRRQANMLIELLIKANQAKNGLNGMAMDCIEERSSYPAYEESSNLSQPVWSSSKQHCTQASPTEEVASSKLATSSPSDLLLKKKKEKSFHIFPAGWSAKVAQIENEDENSNSTTEATEAQSSSVSPESDIKQEASQISSASPLTQSAKVGRKSSSSAAQQQQFNFGKCKVCKDKATGVHYGINSCEGCKGFFKRSLTKSAGYVCFYGDKCAMTPKQRKRCKSCRWKSCLEAGMSFNGIKMGRIPKRLKERASAATSRAIEENDDQSDEDMNDEVASNKSTDPNEETSMADLEEKLFKMKKSMNSLSLHSLDDVLQQMDVEELKRSRLHSNNLNLLSNNSNNSALLTIRNLIRASTTKVISKLDPSTLMAKTSYNKLFLDTTLESNLVVLNLLRDRLYQLYVEQLSHHKQESDQAISLSKQQVKPFSGQNTSLCQLIKSHMRRMTNDFKILFNYLSRMPGIDCFTKPEIECLMKEKIMSIFSFFKQNVWVNDDLWIILPGNVFFNRQSLKRMMGEALEKDIVDIHRLILQLNLTSQEMAVLLPYIVTIDLECWLPDHQEKIIKLNELYKRTLLNELSLNLRSQEYLDNLVILIEKTQALNEKLKRTDIYAELDNCECTLHQKSNV